MPSLSSSNLSLLGHEIVSNVSATVFPLRTVDLSAEEMRHTVVAQGTADLYQGHPTTLFIPDNGTLFCVWTKGHGGPCGSMKRSDDGGRTWSPLIDLPSNWQTVRNCPTIFRLPDATGQHRLFVFAGQGEDECMAVAWSPDEGKTWSPMHSTNLHCVMPYCSILPIQNGKRLIGLTNIRRSPDEAPDVRSNVLAQSFSDDGGFSWSTWEVILDEAGHKYCEPWVVVSPDGSEWLCLIRDNLHPVSSFITSRDEGQSWSAPAPLPLGLAGDRHLARYAPDGRLVVAFRDRARTSETFGHFVAWVGQYEDLAGGGEGDYRIKLLHSYNGADCGYPGLEILPDGTFVATTYIKYRPGSEQNSIVSIRFSLNETDALLLV